MCGLNKKHRGLLSLWVNYVFLVHSFKAVEPRESQPDPTSLRPRVTICFRKMESMLILYPAPLPPPPLNIPIGIVLCHYLLLKIKFIDFVIALYGSTILGVTIFCIGDPTFFALICENVLKA